MVRGRYFLNITRGRMSGRKGRPLPKEAVPARQAPGCPACTNGVSESLFMVGLCLPSGLCVSDDDVCYNVWTLLKLR